MSNLYIGDDLGNAIETAVKNAEKRKAKKEQCPECEKQLALVTMSFRSTIIGKLCRFCSWSSFLQEDKRTQLKAVK